MTPFESALEKIDALNSQDPNTETFAGETHPKEWLYAIRMSEQLVEFAPDASEELRIAARAQHICRWKSPREDYPMDRPGYLRWREDLKKMHAKLTGEILEEVGYDAEFIKRVQFLIRKKQLKKDEGTQTLEDVICLVFLQYYFDEFADKHPDEKIVDILQKTWAKMSDAGKEAVKGLELSNKTEELLGRALG
ncbi:MAG: DUF4202 domain-containing protein [Leeuwenhoekiella sp.]